MSGLQSKKDGPIRYISGLAVLASCDLSKKTTHLLLDWVVPFAFVFPLMRGISCQYLSNAILEIRFKFPKPLGSQFFSTQTKR